MSSFSFLLDENVDRGILGGVRRRVAQLTVFAVGDPSAPALGTPDPEILAWCEAHEFLLITRNLLNAIVSANCAGGAGEGAEGNASRWVFAVE